MDETLHLLLHVWWATLGISAWLKSINWINWSFNLLRKLLVLPAKHRKMYTPIANSSKQILEHPNEEKHWKRVERVDLNVSVNEHFRIERNLQRSTNLKVGFCLCAGCCNKVFLRMIVEIGSSSGILSNVLWNPWAQGFIIATKTNTVIPFWNQTISRWDSKQQLFWEYCFFKQLSCWKVPVNDESWWVWKGPYIYIYLEPKWPLFWLEKALFWRVDLQK